MKIPIYNIVVSLDDDTEYMSAISFVESPAVEYQFITFNKEKPQLKFSVDNELEHKVTSVVCLCDVPIYRYSPDMGEYYVKFNKTAIDNMIYKYSKLGLQNMVNLQHDENKFVDGVTMVEMYQVNREKGILHKDFPDVPDYSLMATFKIDNEEVWNDIISGKCNGYSLELFSSLESTNTFVELSKQEPEQPEEDDINSLIDEFDELFEYLEFKKITRGDIKEILSGNRQVNITIGDITLDNQQVYELGKQNDKDSIVVYSPKDDDWNVYELDTISNIEITDNELENFNFNAKWKQIVENNDLIVTTTKPTGQKDKNSLDYIFDRNLYVMIKYDDEKPNSATGFRTCFLSSWGYTTRGNECIRIYEYSGDTREGFDDGRWRLLLTRRIMDLKSVNYADPIKMPPPLYNGERQANTGRWGTMQNIKRIATFPPKIIE